MGHMCRRKRIRMVVDGKLRTATYVLHICSCYYCWFSKQEEANTVACHQSPLPFGAVLSFSPIPKIANSYLISNLADVPFLHLLKSPIVSNPG